MARKIKGRPKGFYLADKFAETEFAKYMSGRDSKYGPGKTRLVGIPGTEWRPELRRKKEAEEYYKDKDRVRDARKKFSKDKKKTKMKKGGTVKKTKSYRGDGIAKRGRTKGRII
tara:strand:- start:322 stop:663 length:342 start_codon:yes stop_codon:yes gene_type:complete